MNLDLLSIDLSQLESLTDEDLQKLASYALDRKAQDRQTNQLKYYIPVSEKAIRVHCSNAPVFFLAGGNGACLPLHAPVMMGDGSFKALGDIRIGEMVMAAHPVTREAVPVEVTNTFRSGQKEVFRVTFSDGGSFEATKEHQVPLLLGSSKLTTKGHKKHPHKRSLGQYLEVIEKRGISKRISAVSPTEYVFTQTKPLTVDPYLLGALLGDGSLSAPIRFSNIDQGVLTKVRHVVEPYGLELKHYSGCDYGITAGQRGGRENELLNQLRELGLEGKNSYTKFIPSHYLQADRKDRKALLAGLVDTDGGVNSYATCSPKLAEGFCFVVRSLGGKVTSSQRVSRDQNGTEVQYYQIYWRLIERLPLACPQKQANTHTRQIDYSKRICRSVESIGTHECGDIEVDHPAHCYITGDYVIVSNSKTDTALSDLVICATGIIPDSLKSVYPLDKFRGPINCRVVVESITNTLETIILPKLQWWNWQGVDQPGGLRGHYGWIPKHCLIKGEWDKSWTARTRTLEIRHYDPQTGQFKGNSKIQFMSYDQDPADFASGDFHLVLHDEPPKKAIWVENSVRTARVSGRMILSMTWPDDPTIPVDWLIDDVYEKCLPGKARDESYEMVEMYATENKNLDQDAIARMAKGLSVAERATRIYGQHLRLSNRIHPLFTDTQHEWCFECNDRVLLTEKGTCGTCSSSMVTPYEHVLPDLENSPLNPVVCLLDPHPRKPHMLLWAQIYPDDDIGILHEMEINGSPETVAAQVDELERNNQWSHITRLMDPNMGRSPSSTDRETTWQDAFSQVGLCFDLADDGSVGRQIINDWLRPDPYTKKPRIRFHQSCVKTVYQMKRYSWEDHKRSLEKDQKQIAKSKHDDFPTLIKYLANSNPSFRSLKSMGLPVVASSGRSNGY